MIRFLCPTCGKVLKATEDKQGTTAHCPKCGQGVQVPGSAVQKAAAGRPAVVSAPAPVAAAPAKPLVSDPFTQGRRRRVFSWGFYAFLSAFVLFIAFVGFMVQAGKSFNLPLTGGSGETDETDSRLTPEQANRWIKIQKEAADPYIIVGYLKDTNMWRVAVWNANFDTYTWQFKIDAWPEEQKDIAIATCKEVVIKDDNVVATALIDVFSKKKPRVVNYYYRDEKGIYTTPRPPKEKPMLGTSMDQFLLNLQTAAK